MKTLIIAGGSGFLGQVLVNYFKNKTERIFILTRSRSHSKGNIDYVTWDAKSFSGWEAHIDGADALINLTGKSVDCRYNDKNKALILNSRIDSTKILGDAVSHSKNPPKVWLNASTATIYTHSFDKENDEFTGDTGMGFSVGIAKAWENQFFSFKLKDTRQVALRTAIVFGKDGGAFEPIRKMTKLGLGGKQGSGKQKVSWIHEQDFAKSVEFVLNHSEIKDVINIVAPTPITNAELMRIVRKKLNVPIGLPSPKWLLEMGAKVIKTETELILKSRNVIPKKLENAGYKFKYSDLDKAVETLVD